MFVCLLLLLFSFFLDHSSKQIVLVPAVTECSMQTLLKAKKKPQMLQKYCISLFWCCSQAGHQIARDSVSFFICMFLAERAHIKEKR